MPRAITNDGLKKLCDGKDVTLRDLAFAVCGCSQKVRSLNHYLHGRHSPRLEERMASFFGIDVSVLRKELGLEGAES